MTDFSALQGKTLIRICDQRGEFPDEKKSYKIVFVCNDEHTFWMHHHQDCCEGVGIHEIVGDLHDIIGTPILVAERRSSWDEGFAGAVPEVSQDELDRSVQWTFFELRTIKGSVTISWLGSSNGYYSTDADFCDKTTPADDDYCYGDD